MADILEFTGPDGEPYNHAQSQVDLGVCKKIGVDWTINHSAYPPDWAAVRRLRAEIDPYLVPLWVTKVWQEPGGRIFRTGYHVIGRCLPPTIRLTTKWKRKAPIHVQHPVGIPITIPYPVLPALTLCGLTQEQQNHGAPGIYQALDAMVFRQLRYAIWRRNNVHPDEQFDLDKKAEEDAEISAEKSIDDQRLQKLRSRVQFHKPKVFVSETQRSFVETSRQTKVSEGLLRLRALAGTAAVGE